MFDLAEVAHKTAAALLLFNLYRGIIQLAHMQKGFEILLHIRDKLKLHRLLTLILSSNIVKLVIIVQTA